MLFDVATPSNYKLVINRSLDLYAIKKNSTLWLYTNVIDNFDLRLYIICMYCIIVFIICFAVTPISPGEQPISNPLSATQATIGWTAPSDTDLLTGYRVNYASVPLNPVTSRRKREAPPSGSVLVVGAATTSTVIPTCAFSNVTASVDVVYPGGRTAPLLQPTTFQTAEAGMYVR